MITKHACLTVRRSSGFQAACAALAISLLASTTPAATELVKNGTFAETTAQGPAQWGVNNLSGGARVTAALDAQKQPLLRLHNATAEDRCNVDQQLTGVTLTRGTVLRLSGLYRTEAPVAGTNPQCFVSATLDTNPAGGTDLRADLAPTNAWTPFEAQVGVDRDCTADIMVLAVLQRQQGALELRQVSLQVVDSKEEFVLFALKRATPRMDGNLDDACWSGAQKATGFMTLGKLERAAADVEAMACYDEERLYIAIRCQEPRITNLVVDSHPPYCNGDCIEVFLGPDEKGGRYFHFIVDSVGHCWTAISDSVEKEAEYPVEAKAQRQEKTWTVEASVPFAALGTTRPADNQAWRFNIGRERYADPPAQCSSWSPVGSFSDRDRFGRLIFFSHTEAVADMAYWLNNVEDKRLRRPVVSGYDLAVARSQAKRVPDLWHYNAFGADRSRSLHWGLLGPDGRKQQPEFYAAAMDINRLLAEKSRVDDQIGHLIRADYYRRQLAPAETVDVSGMAAIRKESSAIDDEMNALYQVYGAAFDQDWNKAGLAPIKPRAEAVTARLAALRRATAAQLEAMAAAVARKQPWKKTDWALDPGDMRRNKDGTSERFLWSLYTPFTAEAAQTMAEFESVSSFYLDMLDNMKEPGKYNDAAFEELFRNLPPGIKKLGLHGAFGYAGYFTPAAPWFAEKMKADPSMILRSADGLSPEPTLGATCPVSVRWQMGSNPNHPAIMAYMHDVARHLGELSRGRVDYFMTGHESRDHFVLTKDGQTVFRSVGYDEYGRRAFRAYLQTRYKSIGDLNAKWQTQYASFDAIDLPPDRRIAPPKQLSGLAYEFERWQRVLHARYFADVRRALKEGAPDVPVMSDDSTIYLEGQAYLNFKADTADIYAFHCGPTVEDAVWTALGTLNRKFGYRKALGDYENYFRMYGNAYPSDERLSKRALRQFFWSIFTLDVRYTDWWLHYESNPTSYVAAYGGGVYGLDYDQSIFRWSSTELAAMYARCRAMEKALVESRQETPQMAIIQPCATMIDMAALDKCPDSQAFKLLFDLHNDWLVPENIAHDYLPEEMVLDGFGNLKEYRLLCLPYAPYMSAEFSQSLTKWVRKGGTLVAFGPFAQFDPCGQPLPDDASLFQTLFPEAKRTGPGDWEWSVAGVAADAGPVVLTRPCGKGKVVYLNRPIASFMARPELAAQLRALLRETVPPTALTTSERVQIRVRNGADGSLLLCVRNADVEKAVEADIAVRGLWPRAEDLCVPGTFPVPVRHDNGQTIIRLSLEPGDFTLVRLPKR